LKSLTELKVESNGGLLNYVKIVEMAGSRNAYHYERLGRHATAA
jgi:hypothetical protein